jgi:hypothetical protein
MRLESLTLWRHVGLRWVCHTTRYQRWHARHPCAAHDMRLWQHWTPRRLLLLLLRCHGCSPCGLLLLCQLLLLLLKEGRLVFNPSQSAGDQHTDSLQLIIVCMLRHASHPQAPPSTAILATCPDLQGVNATSGAFGHSWYCPPPCPTLQVPPDQSV